jgi:glycosyltransferase involved in cell wall biosynthesis
MKNRKNRVDAPREAPVRQRQAAPSSAFAVSKHAGLRILIASHGHPALSNGGAEIAAYQLFRGLKERGDCKTWFLGCDRGPNADRADVVFSQPFADDEYIYGCCGFDWFKFANLDVRFRRAFERLSLELKPNIVHFHHYVNFGVEAIQHVKRALPLSKIVVTLHEYLAICHHFGQMITKGHRNLCYQSSPARCQKCFPEFGKSDFFLRKRYIERFFDLVDMFISPSNFLAARYIDWGIPAEKMVVLENLMPQRLRVSPIQMKQRGRVRIGFFGQISALKGADVMFDAAASLAADKVSGIGIEIFGDYRGQPPEFQAAFLERLATAGANMRFHGPYDQQHVDRLMQSVDGVLVPSIWWENSPVVIQEALRNRRPVICSDIGGMAEKVRDGIDGFHFPVGNVMALTDLLRRFADDPSLLTNLALSMTGEPAIISSLDDFVSLYRAISSGELSLIRGDFQED